jgi:transposase InsO family protein
MSRRGDCYGNAPVESFFATLKKELLLEKCSTPESRLVVRSWTTSRASTTAGGAPAG